ncbi:hypothetical protein BUALT_Bualt07G0128700 [Buddleja alternifolia]|uniref:Uncharacterized protein n=1 Tax=Buddleja alternifolia TaxID=168488 RepID=A0AAV6XL80_9LAMI|nr:hypothetical protein BUALT_Bualt07G0128700 [Buddleja alternifolia]
MDDSSYALSQLFQRIIEWRKIEPCHWRLNEPSHWRLIEPSHRRLIEPADVIDDKVEIPWTARHLLLLGSYVLNLNSNTNSSVLCATKSCLDELLHCSYEADGYRKAVKTLMSFTENLQVLFMVPKPHQLSDNDAATLKRNEIMSAFINFLLKLLYNSNGGSSSRDLMMIEDRMKRRVEKELRFVEMVLGDTSLLVSADEEIIEVENMLDEFEAVANEAGSVVHSFIFSTTITNPVALDSLFQHIEDLKGNIMKFSNLQPCIVKTFSSTITPKMSTVDSLFVVNSVLDDLEHLIDDRNKDKSLIVDVKGQIKILHHWLELSRSFLREHINVPPYSELKQHLMRIRDVAYQVEYLINSFLVGDSPLWYLTIRLPDVIYNIKHVGTRLKEINESYDIGALNVAKDFSAPLSLQAKQNSEVGDVVGFEDNTIYILDQLVGGKEHLQIISIFGMPGLGKTTLAKKLYDHPSVNYHFDRRSWCVVSHTYQRKCVLVDISISITNDLTKDEILNMEEESLGEHIYKSLKGRRYLIVMDDVWNSNVWNDLRRYFPDDGNGSRILFTSRNKDAVPPNGIIHELPTLSNEQCWELLQKKLFQGETCPPQLVGSGKKIAANCSGLPLAVVVIAGILSTMDREMSTWENVGGSLASYIFAQGNNSTMQILELSYKHLPYHLKPCFLYFAAFQEDKRIPVRKLKSLWIAEGFICKEERKSLESVAEEYLMELIDKSLVIVSGRRSDGGVKNCVIHDLLRDLCLRRAEEENFLKFVTDNHSIYAKHQRLYVPMRSIGMPSIYDDLHPHLGLYGQHVRSFLGYLQDSPLCVINMKLLRVLDCWKFNSCRDFVGIELVIHLRYLAIHRMPASISSLVNLEFLLVNGKVCISSSILKMVKLRYLQADEARFDQDCDPSSLANYNLQMLSTVNVYNLKDEEILKCLTNLRKLKYRCEPLMVGDGSSYRYPDLRFLSQLESLHMINVLRYEIAAVEINFPLNIKKLTLSGLNLPWEKMSIVGRLTNLQVLKVVLDAFVGETWDTRNGEFQQLRFLKMELLQLNQWNASSEHFPKLQQLVLNRCTNLQEIPCEIGEIDTLPLIEVHYCQKSVVESAIQIQEEQRDMGNEELRIIIRSYVDMPFV